VSYSVSNIKGEKNDELQLQNISIDEESKELVKQIDKMKKREAQQNKIKAQ